VTPWGAALDAEAIRPGAAADAVDGVTPAWVLTPPDVDAVTRVVAAACEGGRAIVASGRGRHLDMAAPPRALDATVRLERLGRVVAHDPADMTVTVQAGCSLAALDHVLAAAGQWLPLDPPCPEETTVGGLIAANLSGPLRCSHGTVRDWLIGITVVGVGGKLVRGGGRVVKNVAGYDLPKLHVGAFGTTGVIVEATFKVKPRPVSERACVFEVGSLGAAFELALALRDEVEPSWLEVERAAGVGPVSVSAGFAGSAAWVDEAMARAAAVQPRLDAVAIGLGAAHRAALSNVRLGPGAAVLRIATLPTDLGPLLDRVAGGHAGAHVVASAAAGVAHVRVAEVVAAHALLGALRAKAPAGSVVVVERGVPDAKRGIDVWGEVGAAGALMRGLKAAFDLAGVFAPGRFVAGM
jgi:glycolate oxidase FAD binding subunit